MATGFEFINDPFTFIAGLIITSAAVIGVLYKGMRWLRDEVKKENMRIRDEVKEENTEIKKETKEQVEQNRKEVKAVAENITKELTYTKEIISTKLDTIQDVTKENKIHLEAYAKDIGRTVERNNAKVHEHESRLSVLENQLRSVFQSKPNTDNLYARKKPDYDNSHNNNE
jgi:vacuolar-type H+-ATPase subunit I/STV1